MRSNVENMKIFTVLILCFEFSMGVIVPNDRIDTGAQNMQKLYEAVRIGDKSSVIRLLQYGAKIDEESPDGNTALMFAVNKGYSEIVELLIKSGADVNHVNHNGDSVLTIATTSGIAATVDLLIKKGAYVNFETRIKDTPIMLAAEKGYTEIVNLLIKNGANVNQANTRKVTSLILAAWKGHIDIVISLINSGANVNAMNNNGDTALILSADKGHTKVVSTLIRNGAKVNQSNAVGNTALILASDKGYKEIVDSLIQARSNLSQTNKYGDTALHVAAFTGREAIVSLLLQNGANRTIKNENGKLAKDLAIEKGFTKISQMLSNNVSNVSNAVNTVSKKRVAEQACDIYSNTLSNRILGGALAASGEFPWMAALGYLDQSYKISFDCGGTLISDEFILTAAHCARDTRRPVVVRLGKLTLVDDGGIKAENHQIREIIRHSDYSAKEKRNDIALIQLVKRVWFTDFIRPACLQTNMRDENSKVSLTVTGWGIISTEWRNRSKVLQKADLQTVPISECNKVFLDYNKDKMLAPFKNGISESQYCAFDPQHRSDSCEGDSGGPLQIISPDQVLAKIVGVVSFGVSCGTHLPGIYTRVAYFLKWIESHVWQNGQIAPPLNSESMNI